MWVRGELDLVIVSIAARGEITLKTDGSRTDLHGKFCGEVDCFFFSISGCVEINVSATLGSLPDPPSPVVGVDLVARQGHVSAKAVTGGGAAPAAWIDAIPVIHFVHTVENGVSGGQFAVGQPMPGPVWSGSRDVKHAYRITAVRLEPTTGPPLDPTDRNPVRLRLVVARGALDHQAALAVGGRDRGTRTGAALLGAVDRPAAADRARRVAR